MTKTLQDQAMDMYQRKAFNTLKLFKKTKKKSWSALGINPKMEALIMKGADTIYGNNPATVLLDTPINIKGTVTGRLPAKRLLNHDLSGPSYKYTPREIHRLKGQSSHGTIALVAQVAYHEKFRSDPRFPLFQIMERVKRYKAIFAGPPYKPIFS